MLTATVAPPRPQIIPLNQGWRVLFPECGSEFTADGGPLTYQQCEEAIERWELERMRIQAQGV